ncbi:Hypothetical predicted protein, partial [Mytilus galloprovincialis]
EKRRSGGGKIKIKIKGKGKKIKIKIKQKRRKRNTTWTKRSVHPPCIISDWAAWSSPDSNGISSRTRYLIRPAPNNECGHLHVVEFRNG